MAGGCCAAAAAASAASAPSQQAAPVVAAAAAVGAAALDARLCRCRCVCERARCIDRFCTFVSDSQPSSQPLILVHGAASAGWNVARCTRELPSEILLARASPLSAAPPYHTTTHLGVSKRDILLLHRPLAHGVVMNGSDSDDGPRWCSANTARLCARRTTRRPRSSKHRAALYWHDAAD